MDVIRGDVKRLYAQGHFDDIRVEEEDGKAGKIIIFWVKEKKTIRSVKYEGLNSITNSEVLEKLREKKGRSYPGIDLRSQQDQESGNDHQNDAGRERASGCQYRGDHRGHPAEFRRR